MSILSMKDPFHEGNVPSEKVAERWKRDGNWLDEMGCCKVCDGEIPDGHMDNCDILKLERAGASLQAQLDCVTRDYEHSTRWRSKAYTELSERLHAAVAQAEDAWKRMDRARAILTNDNPRPNCNWGMLDTIPDRAKQEKLKPGNVWCRRCPGCGTTFEIKDGHSCEWLTVRGYDYEASKENK